MAENGAGFVEGGAAEQDLQVSSGDARADVSKKSFLHPIDEL